jgi:hypothetical protein
MSNVTSTARGALQVYSSSVSPYFLAAFRAAVQERYAEKNGEILSGYLILLRKLVAILHCVGAAYHRLTKRQMNDHGLCPYH